MDQKSQKSEKQNEPEILAEEDQTNIVIYDMDNIDKIHKDIIEANDKIQILKSTVISGSPLEIKIKEKRYYICKNNSKYDIKRKILTIPNGDIFSGKVNVAENFLKLLNGVYTWKTGEKYIGSFNQNNEFDGYGKIVKEKGDESFSLVSNFKNGFPGTNSIFNLKKKNEYDLYVESDIIKEEKKGKVHLILNGRTSITKKENGKEVYRFDGQLEKGKINEQASIQRKYKKTRDIDIYLVSKKLNNNIIELDMTITTTKGDKNFYYEAKYINGLRVDNYIIQDEDSDSYRRKIKRKSEINHVLTDLNKALLTITGKECFEKLYRYELDPLKLFNRLYHTKLTEQIKVCHVNQKTINLMGFVSLCSTNFTYLKELALNDCGLTDMHPLEKANFPKLESLSLGKNKIVLINSINNFGFPNLQVIMLGYNKISDITALGNYHSTKLKTLALLDNNISNLNPLLKLNAPNLEIISLGCNINDISALIKCKFPKLKQLGLKNNKIKDISCIKEFEFPNLEILYLSINEIVDITPLKSVKFPKLKVLSLDNNKIRNIRPLLSIPDLRLSSLNISHNKFRPYSSENRSIIENLGKYIEVIKM